MLNIHIRYNLYQLSPRLAWLLAFHIVHLSLLRTYPSSQVRRSVLHLPRHILLTVVFFTGTLITAHTHVFTSTRFFQYPVWL